MRSQNKTTLPARPQMLPQNPRFSSGPCTKFPGWDPATFSTNFLGRSHRAQGGKARLKSAIDRTHTLLGLPDDYLVGIVPASDTGAVEMALWSLLGARGVDVLAWESFGAGWANDITKHLKLDDVRIFPAEYGTLPDLTKVDFSRDVVFTWNGTTSGVRVPDGDWIDADREGLTIADATSAAFAQDIDWPKIDVATFSWQKVLGGEAQHGMIILSPRAVARLESHTPPWPIPKIFRLSKGGKLISGIFEGATINTPSMLALEDYHAALDWAETLGGLSALTKRADNNLQSIERWAETRAWVDFLATVPKTRSNTSICLKIVAPEFASAAPKEQAAFSKRMATRLADAGAAFDIGSYRDAPPGLRIWAGATVENADIHALLPWLDWAFAEEMAAFTASL